MTIEHRDREHAAMPFSEKFGVISAAYQMRVFDKVIRVLADGVSGAFAVTLPPVAEAAGNFYSIVCRGADAVNAITLQDKDDSECWAGDITLNGRCDSVLLYSDGLKWHVLASVLTFTGTTSATSTSGVTTPNPVSEAPQC